MNKVNRKEEHNIIYKGVHYVPRCKKYRGHFTKNRVYHDCGLYNTPKEAAIARDKRILSLGFNIKLQVYKKLEKTEAI